MSGDHFNGHAAEYAKARPTYPVELYDWLTAVAPGRDLVWDVGCGNGQASLPLAERFAKVVATDISSEQLDAAKPHPNVEYRVGNEQTVDLPAGSCDLVTVAQAAHWFDLPSFTAECKRVLKPKGLMAIWGYGLTKFAPEIDVEVQRFYSDVVGPFWPSGREHLDNEYRSLDLHLEEINPPPFAMRIVWDLPEFVAYLDTWSAVQRYRKAKGEDPLPPFANRLQTLWGDVPRVVSWPLYLRVGRPT